MFANTIGTVRWLATAVALCAVVAGCGSSGNSTTGSPATAPTTTTSALTKGTFIAQAHAICQAGRIKLTRQQSVVDAVTRAEQSSDTPANRDALAAALDKFVRIASPELDQLRALEPPASDRVVISKYLAGVAPQISLLEQFVTAVRSNDAQAVQMLATQLQQGKALVQGLGQGYGFKVCGSGT